MRKLSEINEGVFRNSIIRTSNGGVRREDGEVIGKTDDGKNIIVSSDLLAFGKPIYFGDLPYMYVEDYDGYIVCLNSGNNDCICTIDNDEDSNKANVVELFTCSTSLREKEFGPLLAVMECWGIDNFDDLGSADIKDYRDHMKIETNGREFLIFFDHDDAYELAVESTKDHLDGNLTRSELKRFYEFFGDDFLDVDGMEEELRYSYESMFDDFEEDDAIEELIRLNIIKETEDYFDVDEDGDVDTTMPKFDYGDYKDEYVDKMMDGIFNVADEFTTNFGYESLEQFTDYDKLSRLIVDDDGVGNSIASYDGEENHYVINGEEYYVYVS